MVPKTWAHRIPSDRDAMNKSHTPFETRALRDQSNAPVDDAPTREEAWRRINSKPGFISSLSPEALEYIKNYDGPENMGPPHPRR